MRESFLSLSDEEMFKYFEIFKKTLSGTIGKNLLNLEFPLKAEAEDGEQEFLLRLKNSRLTDDALVDECYDKIIEHYYNAENYFIILVHAAYDVPGKAKDNTEMFDSSMRFTNTSCAASARSGSPKPDCATTKRKTASVTVSVTGSWNFRNAVSCSRHFMIAALTCMRCSTIQKSRKNFRQNLWKICLAVKLPLLPGNRRNHSKLLFPTLSVKNVIMKHSKISMTI